MIQINLRALPQNTLYGHRKKHVQFCAVQAKATHGSWTGCKENTTYSVTRAKTNQVLISTGSTKVPLATIRKISRAIRLVEKQYKVAPSVKIDRVKSNYSIWCITFSKRWTKNRLTLSLLMTHIRLEFHKAITGFSTKADTSHLKTSSQLRELIKKKGLRVLNTTKPNTPRGIVDYFQTVKYTVAKIKQSGIPISLIKELHGQS
jgi:hypothetical protein